MTKTHTMRSRLISLVLVLVMVLGCLPLSALAADPADLVSAVSSQTLVRLFTVTSALLQYESCGLATSCRQLARKDSVAGRRNETAALLY